MAQDNNSSTPNPPFQEDLFVAGVVHDMNQLFGVIMGRVGKILEANPDPHTRADLEAILLATKDATAMAHRLRGYSTEGIEQNNAESVKDVVKHAVQLSASDEDRLKWPVTVGVPSGMFCGMTGQLLREVLNNLLRNAQEAMPDGGSISIVAANKEGQIQLLVMDQGPGLEPAIGSKIFEKGYSTSGKEGRGIGLPASRMLVESSGGTLSLVPSDGGALFELLIPVAEGIPKPINAPAERVTKIAPGTHVLVVDDDQAMREMLADVLGAMGCQVVTVRDATSALEKMGLYSFHVALLDQNLPGMKGMDLAPKLRALDPYLTMVLVTGWGNEDINIDSSQSTISILARKPLEFGAIRDLIGHSIDIRNTKIQIQSKESGE